MQCMYTDAYTVHWRCVGKVTQLTKSKLHIYIHWDTQAYSVSEYTTLQSKKRLKLIERTRGHEHSMSQYLTNPTPMATSLYKNRYNVMDHFNNIYFIRTHYACKNYIILDLPWSPKTICKSFQSTVKRFHLRHHYHMCHDA